MSETFRLTDLLNSLALLERRGQRLYGELAARHAAQPELKALFTELAGWERKHEQLYTRLLHEAEAGDAEARVEEADPDYGAYLRALVESALHLGDRAQTPCQDLRAALAIVLQLEKDTLLFLDAVTPHLPAPHLPQLASVLREERRHVAMLQRLLAKAEPAG
ncbi:MAG: ferritin family protein [Lentisphaeria bacterium]|jgi:rubrerythrin